jgi:hypothetical protein
MDSWSWSEGDVTLQPDGVFWRDPDGNPIAFQSFEDLIVDGPPMPAPDDVVAALRAHAERATADHGELHLRVDGEPIDMLFIRLGSRQLACFHCELRPTLPFETVALALACGAHRLEIIVERGARRTSGSFDLTLGRKEIVRWKLRIGTEQFDQEVEPSGSK